MDTTREDLGKLLLRLSVGTLMLLHGMTKARGGISFVENLVAEAGLPALAAYGVYVGELVAPILLIIGLFTRPAGIILAIDMLMAIALGRRDAIASLNQGGGWAIELEVLFGLGGLAIAFLGAGRYAVSRGRGRWD
jgi:putative oxidoreductase